jgi:hypothetical protein
MDYDAIVSDPNLSRTISTRRVIAIDFSDSPPCFSRA